MRTTILAYHAIGSCDPANDPYSLWVDAATFARQMAFLARRRQVVALSDILERRVPTGPPAVAITFDDGYRTVLDHAVPVLRHHGFPATMFVPTAHVGDRNRWDPPQACDLSIVDEEGLREFEAAGVRVESHGHAHLDLRTTDADTTRLDLQTSRERLAAILGRPPNLLAFPFRDGSEAARLVARAVGFDAAFSIDLPHAGRYGWARVQVTPKDSHLVFAAKTTGAWPQVRHHPATDFALRARRALMRRLDRAG